MPSAMVSQRPLRVPYAMRNAGPAAGETDVLAGKARTQYVYRIDLSPVQLVQITMVRQMGMTSGQQRTHVSVIVSDPRELSAKHFHDGHVEAAVAGAE